MTFEALEARTPSVLTAKDRAVLLEIARRHGMFAIAVVIDIPLQAGIQRHRRPGPDPVMTGPASHGLAA